MCPPKLSTSAVQVRSLAQCSTSVEQRSNWPCSGQVAVAAIGQRRKCNLLTKVGAPLSQFVFNTFFHFVGQRIVATCHLDPLSCVFGEQVHFFQSRCSQHSHILTCSHRHPRQIFFSRSQISTHLLHPTKEKEDEGTNK